MMTTSYYVNILGYNTVYRIILFIYRMVVFFAAITMKMHYFYNRKENYFHLGITLSNRRDKNEHSLLYPQHSLCEEI